MVVADAGLLAGPPWSSLVDEGGLRMALGSIWGHEGLCVVVVGEVATWSCRLTYSVWLGSNVEVGTE